MAYRREGFWLPAKSWNLIPIYDHMLWLSDLESKARNELLSGAKDKKLASSLGLVPGAGWGNVSRETPAARKERFMREAMKAGWTRIRVQDDNRVHIEFWRQTSDLMANLYLALKKTGLFTGQTQLELHEVATGNSVRMDMDALGRQVRGEEATPEEVSATGFSVYSNPPRWGMRANGRERGSRREFRGGIAIAGGPFRTAETGRWNPLEHPLIFGRYVRMNPYEQQSYVEPAAGEGETVARFFLGLKVGTGAKARVIKPEEVFQFVQEVRKEQLGGEAPGGASFIAQRGFFTHWEQHPAKVADEDSLQIVIYPDGRAGATGSEFGPDYKIRPRTFEQHMHELAPALAEHFKQQAVILNLVVNGKLKYLGDYHRA